jgi:hypothetical protein
MTAYDVQKIDEQFYNVMTKKSNERQSTERSSLLWSSSENDETRSQAKSFAEGKKKQGNVCRGKNRQAKLQH